MVVVDIVVSSVSASNTNPYSRLEHTFANGVKDFGTCPT